MPEPNERQFQRAVTDAAMHLGWRYHHEANSFGSKPGFPDLFLVHRNHGILLLELKTGKRRTTEAQQDWIDYLDSCGLPAYVVRPADMDWIIAMLEGKPVAEAGRTVS